MAAIWTKTQKRSLMANAPAMQAHPLRFIRSLMVCAALVFSQFAMSQEGGWSSGGGFLDRSVSMNEQLVMDMVQTAHQFLPRFFTLLEHYSHDDLPKTLKRKLYDGSAKQTIFSALNRVHYKYLAKGPCYESDGTPRDAAVDGQTPNTICISLENLTAQSNKTDALQRVFAIIAHETAHLSGATEAEGKLIQRFALSEPVNPGDVDRWKWKTFKTQVFFRRLAESFRKSQREIREKQKAGLSPKQICDTLNLKTVEGYLTDVLDIPLGLIRLGTYEMMRALADKKPLIELACTPETNELKQTFAMQFKGKDVIFAHEVDHQLFSGGFETQAAMNVKLQYIHYLDIETLKLELADAEQRAFDLLGAIAITGIDMENAVPRPIKNWATDLLEQAAKRQRTHLAGIAISDLLQVLSNSTFEFRGAKTDERASVSEHAVTETKLPIDPELWATGSHDRRVQMVLEAVLPALNVPDAPKTAQNIMTELRDVNGVPLKH